MKKETLSIAAVSEETGIAKEVLRKWEERYGFPLPERDNVGTRLYPAEQARRLKLIKRLLDDGMRPGQVVPADEASLATLLAARKLENLQPRRSAVADQVVRWLQLRDPESLRDSLQNELARLGLRGFITAMAEMNEAVGDAWADGRVSVKDEHLYTETIQSLVRAELREAACGTRVRHSPRILLTTVSGELHTLGLLMAETILTLEGAACISLGAQTPHAEIVAAAQAYNAEIVALSFSAAFPKKKVLPLLRELRMLCAPAIRLWAGGSGVVGLGSAPRGVSLLPTLESGVGALRQFRERRPGVAAEP